MRSWLMASIWFLLMLPMMAQAETETVAREVPLVSAIDTDYPLRTDITQVIELEKFQLVTDDLFCQSMKAEYRLNWNGALVINEDKLPMNSDYLFRDGLIVAEQVCILLPEQLKQAEEYVGVVQDLVTMHFGQAVSTIVNQLATSDWYREVKLTNELGDKMIVRWQGRTLLVILTVGPPPTEKPPLGLLLPK